MEVPFHMVHGIDLFRSGSEHSANASISALFGIHRVLSVYSYMNCEDFARNQKMFITRNSKNFDLKRFMMAALRKQSKIMNISKAGRGSSTLLKSSSYELHGTPACLSCHRINIHKLSSEQSQFSSNVTKILLFHMC